MLILLLCSFSFTPPSCLDICVLLCCMCVTSVVFCVLSEVLEFELKPLGLGVSLELFQPHFNSHCCVLSIDKANWAVLPLLCRVNPTKDPLTAFSAWEPADIHTNTQSVNLWIGLITSWIISLPSALLLWISLQVMKHISRIHKRVGVFFERCTSLNVFFCFSPVGLMRQISDPSLPLSSSTSFAPLPAQYPVSPFFSSRLMHVHMHSQH